MFENYANAKAFTVSTEHSVGGDWSIWLGLLFTATHIKEFNLNKLQREILISEKNT
ncbi:uncharacterized protein NEPG_01792 [Nematocida parisii ERTm1]|uniref:uncharacterized protein n=1 Tax=Nematocida parisii (strain ERTm1 / ATCC PRA-289) TaxID=881290 RepID=UPI000264B3E7|nr:uncharacterized protein NEPG_01792 [Nematocida parisii ERTm1]EIJ93450.1 hypothetical protein NEPG_01792 [Nematocida parisii ERTm1]|eukprot:XP_013059620.1 hypothetical protein NEPG_01792 [Nematocida parisii ERTm1]